MFLDESCQNRPLCPTWLKARSSPSSTTIRVREASKQHFTYYIELKTVSKVKTNSWLSNGNCQILLGTKSSQLNVLTFYTVFNYNAEAFFTRKSALIFCQIHHFFCHSYLSLFVHSAQQFFLEDKNKLWRTWG